jgi:hemerythrin superfamily protein
MASKSAVSVVQLLKAQHQQIKSMFEAVNSADAKNKQERFDELRSFLSVHETAEELITHPRARMAEGGSKIVDARLAEEHESKKMLSELDGFDVSDPSFAAKFTELRRAVLAHADAEEREEFPLLEQDADPKMLERMATAVRAAEAIAPTRPHPMAGESAVINALTGPLASIVDRTRDVVRNAMRETTG